MIPVKETAASLEFKVLVVPRSSRNKIVGAVDDALKVKLMAPPVEGAANRMCLEFLAKAFEVPKSSLGIVSGQSGRHKVVAIRFAEDSEGSEHLRRIKALLSGY
ncbi:MAG: DUF167 domain-containing protein [Thermodesulfobacteriota bacterium]